LRRPVELAQYVSLAYSERLAAAGIRPSAGAVGSSFDNALAETINGLYKTELIKKSGPWRGVDHVELATAEWVGWFNHRRLYEYCGDVPPAEMEQAHYAQIRTQQTAELSNRCLRICRCGSIGSVPKDLALERCFGAESLGKLSLARTAAVSNWIARVPLASDFPPLKTTRFGPTISAVD